MCDLCNGTYVFHTYDSSKALFQPCPKCGPEPEEVFTARMKVIMDNIAVAKRKRMKKGA